MKPITNLAISGITKCSQMKKLAKLTGTKTHPSVLEGKWKNTNGVVSYWCYRSNYMDYTSYKDGLKHMTWKNFLKKYDNPSKQKLKRLRKKNKALKRVAKEPWSTNNLKDKELVWCWNYGRSHEAVLRFWDKINRCTFLNNGGRNGPVWNIYAPFIKGKLPPHMKQARKTLKD